MIACAAAWLGAAGVVGGLVLALCGFEWALLWVVAGAATLYGAAALARYQAAQREHGWPQ